MSDTALIIIVGSFQAVALAAIAAFLKGWQDKIASVAVHLAQVHEEVKVVKADVNGKMAQLLEVTGAAEHAKGKLEGIEEAKPS